MEAAAKKETVDVLAAYGMTSRPLSSFVRAAALLRAQTILGMTVEQFDEMQGRRR